jgi:uncharacterized repeat protein (TIGR03803 family)
MWNTIAPILPAAFLVFAFGFPALTTPALGAAKETVLHDFGSRGDGFYPVAGLTSDRSGNLYGTAPRGGNTLSGCGELGCGVVFRLTSTGKGKWKESILYSFTGGKDGGSPQAGVILDAEGNVYGTAYEGGDTSCGYWTVGCGVVFELVPTSHGQWKEKVLHTFEGSDGENPAGGLIFDAVGNLYGTTWGGGAGNCLFIGCGVVFELTPTCGGKWKEKVLYRFTGGDDGAEPAAGLTSNARGDLFGTTVAGGGSNDGVVFELKKVASGKWGERVLHSFSGADGAAPYAGLTFGPSGRLYGTTLDGGSSSCDGGCGLAFELEPRPDGAWVEKVLHKFCSLTFCHDGYAPYAGLVADSIGNLYGTTLLGGSGYGTIFELMPTEGKWTETVLKKFSWDFPSCPDGAYPVGGLIFDAAGNLYGTASGGGTSCGDAGVAFELTLQLVARTTSD